MKQCNKNVSFSKAPNGWIFITMITQSTKASAHMLLFCSAEMAHSSRVSNEWWLRGSQHTTEGLLHSKADHWAKQKVNLHY